MPLIHVILIEGRSPETKTALIGGFTEASIEATGGPRESIRVILP